MAKFEQRVDINAPMDTVWQILTDATTWAHWFPDAEIVTGLTSVSDGSTFQYQHGGKTANAVIDQVDHDRGLVRVTTTLDGKQETHTFDLDKRSGFLGMGGGSAMMYRLEYDPAGGLFGDFIAGGNPMDSMQVRNTLGRLKSLAERRS